MSDGQIFLPGVTCSARSTELGGGSLGQGPLGQGPLGQGPLGQGPLGQARAGQRLEGSAPYSLTRSDAVTWLRTLPSESVDLVVTDPPYESLEKHRAIGTTTRLKHSKASSNDWFHIFPNQRFPELFAEVYRVLRPNRHFYLFCDQETMFAAKPMAETAGFRFWKPLVWDKRKIGMGYHYRARYELILFFEKGKRKLADLSIPDIIECPRIHRGYPTQKPTAVTDVLVRQSSEPGMLVVDPFSGSGTTGVSAVAAQRRFMGSDICGEALQIAGRRLDEVVSQQTLSEQPKAEQPKADQTKADQTKADQTKAGQTKAGQTKAGNAPDAEATPCRGR